jgi:hypothetical protein
LGKAHVTVAKNPLHLFVWRSKFVQVRREAAAEGVPAVPAGQGIITLERRSSALSPLYLFSIGWLLSNYRATSSGPPLDWSIGNARRQHPNLSPLGIVPIFKIGESVGIIRFMFTLRLSHHPCEQFPPFLLPLVDPFSSFREERNDHCWSSSENQAASI